MLYTEIVHLTYNHSHGNMYNFIKLQRHKPDHKGFFLLIGYCLYTQHNEQSALVISNYDTLLGNCHGWTVQL